MKDYILFANDVDPEVLDAINVIVAHEDEEKAIELLFHGLMMQLACTNTKASRAEAQLRMIKKLNQGKNEAIDAMCEIEED